MGTRGIGGSPETPKSFSTQKTEKGNVAQELIETLDLATTFIVPRNLTRANRQNEVYRLKGEYKKDRLKGSLEDRVKVLPIAGDVHLAARPIFDKYTKAGGYAAKKGIRPFGGS